MDENELCWRQCHYKTLCWRRAIVAVGRDKTWYCKTIYSRFQNFATTYTWIDSRLRLGLHMSPCSTCPQCNPQVEAPPPALKSLLLRLQMITPLWLRFLVGGNTKENWQKLIEAGLASPLLLVQHINKFHKKWYPMTSSQNQPTIKLRTNLCSASLRAAVPARNLE